MDSKRILWRSEPSTKSLDGKYLLTRENQRAFVCGHLAGVGGVTYVLAFETDKSGLKYIAPDDLVGYRIYDTKSDRNRAQAIESRTYPAQFAQAAAA